MGKRLAFIFRNPCEFVLVDERLLSESWDVEKVRFTFSPMTLWVMWRAIRRSDLTFVWFGNVWATIAVFFAKLCGKKSVIVAGGYDVETIPDIGDGLPLHPILRHFAYYAFTHADLVLPFSLSAQSSLNAFCRPRASLLVPCAVDLPMVAPDPTVKENMVLTVGRVHKGSSRRKGHYLFLEAASRLPDIPFILYGGQFDETADELRRLAPPNVTLVDYAGRDVLLDYLKRAKIYAQFSYIEGFGIAMVEAMWCGCTPVVTPRGAMPEIVGDSGIVTESLDPDELARAVRQALQKKPVVNEHAIGIARAYTLDARRDGLRQMAAMLGFPH